MQTSVEKQPIKILVDAIKKVVTHSRTPDWIKRDLEAAVKEARSAYKRVDSSCRVDPGRESESSSDAPEMREADIEPISQLAVGALCVDAVSEEDSCLYEITAEGMTIDGVKLWDVRVARGDKRTPAGVTIHNVPSTFLKRARQSSSSSSASS